MFRRSCAWLVAAGQGPFDPYKILGVEPGASKQEIKRAYHRLALRFHPDGGPEGNADRFNAVHEAYETVKDGKWKPTAEQQRSTMQEGQGWDPKMRMYVYEKPGSTTENYVNSHTQTLLRLAMVWCFLFVVVRFFLLQVFPNSRARMASPASASETTTLDGFTGSAVTNNASVTPRTPARESSIHDEDDEEASWSVGAHSTAPGPEAVRSTTFVDDGATTDTAVDPLARRSRWF